MSEATTSNPIYVLSSPGTPTRAGRSVMPVSNYASPQVLLGFDAQLEGFAACLRALDAPVFVALAPEMFSSRGSLDWLLRQLGLQPGEASRLRHLRFGPARSARALAGVANAFVAVESPADPDDAPAERPYASGRVLPASVGQVFHPASQPPPALRRVDGGAIDFTPVPDGALVAGTQAGDALPGTPRPGAALEFRDLSGIHIASFAEFEPAQWAGAAGFSVEVSPHARRMLNECNGANGGGGQHSPAVLLPWNLADPAGLVPELLERFVHHGAGAAAFAVVVAPYNVTPSNQRRIGELVRGTEHALGLYRTALRNRVAVRSKLQGLFLAQVTNAAAMGRLRRLCAAAWIDAGDPEANWTCRRLAACGVGLVALGDTTPLHEGVRETLLATIPLRERGREAVRDEFGRRTVPVPHLSVLELHALIARTVQAFAAAPVAPAAIPPAELQALRHALGLA